MVYYKLYTFLLNNLSRNVRADVTEWEGVVERSDYYPYGMQIRVPWSTMWTQSYKFMGKELDRRFGLDCYDFEARVYDPSVGRFTHPDPMAWDTPWISPYSYCASNPIRYVDPTGENVAVLNLGDDMQSQHLALLVQDQNGLWHYYSMNGYWIYIISDGEYGGKGYNDSGEKSFDSPQAFLDGKYNNIGTKEEIEKNSVSGYNFIEAYEIKTTKEQDKIISEKFVDINENEVYDLVDTNCATTVERSLEEGGIKTGYYDSTKNDIDKRWPSAVFQSITDCNPYGIIYKTHK